MSKKKKKSSKKSSSKLSHKALNLSEKNSEASDTWSSKALNGLIYCIIPTFISLMISTLFDDWFYKLQISKLSNYNTILFIHDSISNWTRFLWPYIMIVLIILVIRNDLGTKFIKFIMCLIIVITISIISTAVLFIEFFNYTDISDDGLQVRSSVFSNIEDYTWSDVQDVKVSYKRGNKSALLISYDIYLKDGKIVHAKESEDFFNNIINLDNLIKSKDIVIDRQKIASKDYDDFVRQYEGPGSAKTDRLQVVLKILDR